MFTKTLIFVLLGVTLVVANPVNQDELVETQTEKSWRSKIGDWLHHVEETLKEYYKESKKAFEEIVQQLKNKGGKAIEISKEKWAELKEKYLELRQKAKKAIEEKKKVWEARLEEWRQKGGEAIEAGKEKFEELKQKAKEAIKQEKAKWEAKLKEWRQKAKEAIEAAKEKIRPEED